MASNIESLARQLATKNNTSIKSEVAKINEVLDVIKSNLSTDSDIILKDFGRFTSVTKSAPKSFGSSERVAVKSVAFKAFDSLKSRVK